MTEGTDMLNKSRGLEAGVGGGRSLRTYFRAPPSIQYTIYSCGYQEYCFAGCSMVSPIALGGGGYFQDPSSHRYFVVLLMRLSEDFP